MTIAAALDTFLADATRVARLRPNTVRAYRADLTITAAQPDQLIFTILRETRTRAGTVRWRKGAVDNQRIEDCHE
jgi:hypothetical protein